MLKIKLDSIMFSILVKKKKSITNIIIIVGDGFLMAWHRVCGARGSWNEACHRIQFFGLKFRSLFRSPTGFVQIELTANRPENKKHNIMHNVKITHFPDI